MAQKVAHCLGAAALLLALSVFASAKASDQDAHAQRIQQLQARPTVNLKQYDDLMFPYWRAAAMAQTATACGLRSQYWVSFIISGVQSLEIYHGQQYSLSNDEIEASAVAKRAALRAGYNAYPYQKGGQRGMQVTCAKLLSSMDLVKLDKFENIIIGNYH